MRVYPRVYGGTSCHGPRRCTRWGLSPRVRGNHASPHHVAVNVRSIPACTGEPRDFSGIGSIPGVYPRVYGGTAAAAGRRPGGRGLSPRVRGNPQNGVFQWISQRSIPACTGEPPGARPLPSRVSVYPRVYGGTRSHGSPPLDSGGLSPRVRGNRDRSYGGELLYRSIPACTGEPCGTPSRRSSATVYPRVYGGTNPG